MAKNKNWTSNVDNSHFATYYFDDNIRGRYLVVSDPVFIRKTTLQKIDIQVCGLPYDFRVSLRNEEPVPGYVAKGKANHVRLHTRWSFKHGEMWQYDFSKVGDGVSKEDACSAKLVYEVELELLKPSDSELKLNNLDLAHHILEKLTDLIGRYDAKTKTPLEFQRKVTYSWKA